jgi:ABC-type multidrug transport system ATPase subunit
MRPISRLIATLGLLLLGTVALTKLPLEYLPRQSFPELTVALTLPESREPKTVARDWVEEIEGAVRSLGRVSGTKGEVRSDGAELTVRFAPGTDPERKAARLESELTGLRRRLPQGAHLTIDPAGQADGELLGLVWLSGVRSDTDAQAAAEVLRSVPGVRAVDTLGVRGEELRVELAPGTLDPLGTAAAVRTAVDQALHSPVLGHLPRGDRNLPVIVPQATPETLAGLPIPLPGGGTAPLGAIATLRTRWPDPPFRVRFRGRPARALYVSRAEGAPLLATDRALRHRLAHLPNGVQGTLDASEAEPLRALLLRLALGLLAASLAAALLGWRQAGLWGACGLGLALPAAVAAGANALWLAGVPLHVTTLTAFALGVTAALPVAGRRVGGPHPRPSPGSPLPSAGRGETSSKKDSHRRHPEGEPGEPEGSGGGKGSGAKHSTSFSAFLPSPGDRAVGAGRGAGGEGSIWLLAALLIAAAAAVPIAVGLAGAELGPLLSEPARAFLIVTAAAVLAALMPPAGGASWSGAWSEVGPKARASSARGNAPGRGEGALRRLPRLSILQKRALRDPATAALTLFTAAAIAATVCGPSLLPRHGDLSPDGGSFNIRLRLPDGSTMAEAESRVLAIEEQLAKAEEVERFYSVARTGSAFVSVQVRARDRHPDRLERLATRLRYQIPGGAAAQIDTGAGAGGGSSLDFDFEERARTDDEANVYRFVLRSADLTALATAYPRIVDRLTSLKVRPHWITGWGRRSVLFTLQPSSALQRAGHQVEKLATALARQSAAPVPLTLPMLPGGATRSLVVVPAGFPVDPDRAVPGLEQLLGRPLRLAGTIVTPGALLSLRQEAIYPRIARQSGRFVLPVEIQLPLSNEDVRRDRRKEIDRSLTQLRLPPGVDVERPALTFLAWQPDRMRLAALALAVPLLLFALAAWRLGSPLRALVALVPLAIGLLAATPLVQTTLGQVDELTIFALAASLCLVLPIAAEAAGAGPGGNVSLRSESGAAIYRGLRRDAGWLAACLVPAALALAVPTLGADLMRFRWVLPLRAAALAGAAALLTAAVAVPALRLAAALWRARDPEEVRRRRRPPVWSAPGLPDLAVRSLTKTYASGHTALSAVSFELTPGITGLLGPNGAGKTTLLRILTGLLEPTRGSVSFRGVPVTADDLAEYRIRIGFLPQEFNAYPDFTAEQFLEHWALERGMNDTRARRAEIDQLLAAVGLAEHARRKVRDYSGGMRQRVGIARALLGAPPILIVDEPTTGLDIESRGRFRQILLEQAADRIVLFSTHIASDIEAAASRILLLHRGRLRFDGAPEELIERARGQVFATLVADADLPTFSHRYRVTARVRRLEGLHVRAVARPGDALGGGAVEPNLEEAYLAEIERTDSADGRERRQETFSFLDRGAA